MNPAYRELILMGIAGIAVGMAWRPKWGEWRERFRKKKADPVSPILDWIKASLTGQDEILIVLKNIHQTMLEEREWTRTFADTNIGDIERLLGRVVEMMSKEGGKDLISPAVLKCASTLESVDEHIVEFVGGQRRIMRSMEGRNGTEDDDIMDRAMAIRENHPEVSLEDAVKRARVLMNYNNGGR